MYDFFILLWMRPCKFCAEIVIMIFNKTSITYIVTLSYVWTIFFYNQASYDYYHFIYEKLA